ncbi:hypothetical protein [Clostridium brassicae]|uniref:Uncharacterized protein n=1 Tax=Clostridium brassicae TaxID=2999072 RepID=A0ABT4D4Q5_9CLOT|nr:hypothetical protein [Clostridium brassicae]MCY6957257.1 hypothetical protein [Clostridium brassicae]
MNSYNFVDENFFDNGKNYCVSNSSTKLDSYNATPHLGLNGKLIKGSACNVYFVWNGGYKCFVPNANTFNNLFKNWKTIIQLHDDELNSISTGPDISNNACLITGNNNTYLLTNGEKHFITAPSVMEYCNFDWKKILKVPQIIIDSIPNGKNIDYGI